MKKIVPYFLVILPVIFLFFISISCTNTKISEQIQMDINDLQNQLLVYRKKQNQMTVILEQLHSEFLLNNDKFLHLENRLLNIENSYESIMSQTPKIQPAENDPIAKKSFPARDFEISSLEQNQDSPKNNSQKFISPITKPINHTYDADNLYDQSLTDLKKNNIESAISGFQEFLKLFPGSQLADNAEYWLAECFYKQQKFDLAIKHFQMVIDRFPEGNKAPAATLKLGYTYCNIGDYNKSLAYLKTIMEKYPDSQEMILAKKKTNEIISMLSNINHK